MELSAGCAHLLTEQAAADLGLSAGFTPWGSEVSFNKEGTFFFFLIGRGMSFNGF